MQELLIHSDFSCLISYSDSSLSLFVPVWGTIPTYGENHLKNHWNSERTFSPRRKKGVYQCSKPDSGPGPLDRNEQF